MGLRQAAQTFLQTKDDAGNVPTMIVEGLEQVGVLARPAVRLLLAHFIHCRQDLVVVRERIQRINEVRAVLAELAIQLFRVVIQRLRESTMQLPHDVSVAVHDRERLVRMPLDQVLHIGGPVSLEMTLHFANHAPQLADVLVHWLSMPSHPPV